MNPVVRGLAVYLFIFILFRIMGKKSLKDTTTFDFVLLLIISETTTDALIGEDYSLLACFIMVSTLLATDLLLAFIKDKWQLLGKLVDGAPLILVDKGKILKKRLQKSRVSEDDVLEAARLIHGMEKIEDIKYAVLERDGSISIIPDSASKT